MQRDTEDGSDATTRAEELLDRQQDRNAADRDTLERGAGMPDTADRSPTETAPQTRPTRRTKNVEATRGPGGRTAREAKFLARNRESMDNDELKQFLQRESSFHDDLKEADDFTPFSDREEQLLIQRKDADIDDLAEELDREPAQIRAKRKLLGLENR